MSAIAAVARLASGIGKILRENRKEENSDLWRKIYEKREESSDEGREIKIFEKNRYLHSNLGWSRTSGRSMQRACHEQLSSPKSVTLTCRTLLNHSSSNFNDAKI